jgi:hypothetical protein
MSQPEKKKAKARPSPANGGPGRLASESENDGTVDPNDSGGKPVPTADEPRLDPQKVPPPNVGGRS